MQRLIVDQINSTSDPHSGGPVDYSVAPWFDWGPYLWANTNAARSDGLIWCNNNGGILCGTERDFRYGDLSNPNMYWGDLTHPTAQAEVKVAGLLVNFIQRSAWVTPWIGK